jgi:hypothetical protein
MLKKYNNHILCRLFERIADIWSEAAQYQIYVILSVMALLAILPLFVTKMSEATNVVLNITIFCTAAVAGFILFRRKGSQMAAFTFIAALLLRLCLVFVFETSTPYMLEDIRIRTQPWIRHYDTVLFQADEYFYIYQGQRYSDMTTSEFINSPDFTNHAYRTSFLISRLFRFFGNDFIWLRLVGAFLGALVAAFITMSAEELFKRNTASVISLFSVLAPQTAFYSVRLLKEIWIIFAVSMMIFGFTMIIRNKKPIIALLSIAAASIFLMWIRLEYGLMFIVTVPIAVCFGRKSSPATRIIAVLFMVLLGTIISIWQLNQFANKAGELFDRYTFGEKRYIAKLDAMDKIYTSRGPLRLLNIPLALLNPPPKNLHHIYTAEKKLFDIVVLSDIYQWWLPLPFLIIGICLIVTYRTEFLVFLLPYIIAIITSALLLGGLQTDILRYRDSLVPIAFIIIGAGIESFVASPKGWKNRIIIAVYTVFVILVCYFYIRGF